MTSREPTEYYKQRRTVESTVEFEGVGLHTGEPSSVELQPAEAGEGLVFERVDLDDSLSLEATVENAVDYPRSTVLGRDDQRIHTVEHLLGTLYALGISDVRVVVDGPEIPAMDGSAQPFAESIRETGINELEATRPLYRPQEPLYVEEGDSTVILLPSDRASYSATVQYDDVALDDQYVSTMLSPDTFVEDVAPARTYGFQSEIEELLDRDLAQGGDLENALVIKEDGSYLGDGPRIDRELARHKVLDLLGDLALTGTFIVGTVRAVKNGHDLNVNLADTIRRRVKKSPAIQNQKQQPVRMETLDIEEIQSVLPHRYPMLLIDRILSVDNDEYFAQGLKNVTINEEFFQGHFPDDPVMPGVLVIEALAQLGAAVILNQPENASKNSYFMGVDNVKWRRPVRPGDQILLETEAIRFRPGARMGKMKGEAYVDGELAAEGEFKFAMVDE